jgi:hypothetical protein
VRRLPYTNSSCSRCISVGPQYPLPLQIFYSPSSSQQEECNKSNSDNPTGTATPTAIGTVSFFAGAGIDVCKGICVWFGVEEGVTVTVTGAEPAVEEEGVVAAAADVESVVEEVVEEVVEAVELCELEDIEDEELAEGEEVILKYVEVPY